MNDQQVVVAHPRTHEVISLSTATDQELASVKYACEEVALELVKANRLLSDEVLARMDRSAKWTRDVQIGDQKYAFTAPSPKAGAVTYDADLLEVALDELVGDGTIDPDTASEALVRELTVTIAVPWGTPIDDAVRDAHELTGVKSVKPSVKTNLPTINRLLKVDAVASAVKVAQETAAPKERAVKFGPKS